MSGLRFRIPNVCQNCGVFWMVAIPCLDSSSTADPFVGSRLYKFERYPHENYRNIPRPCS